MAELGLSHVAFLAPSELPWFLVEYVALNVPTFRGAGVTGYHLYFLVEYVALGRGTARGAAARARRDRALCARLEAAGVRSERPVLLSGVACAHVKTGAGGVEAAAAAVAAEAATATVPGVRQLVEHLRAPAGAPVPTAAASQPLPLTHPNTIPPPTHPTPSQNLQVRLRTASGDDPLSEALKLLGFVGRSPGRMLRGAAPTAEVWQRQVTPAAARTARGLPAFLCLAILAGVIATDGSRAGALGFAATQAILTSPQGECVWRTHMAIAELVAALAARLGLGGALTWV
jgi:hypothetical protein